MLVSKVTVAIGVWDFCSLIRHARLSAPTNLAANLNARKRSDATTVSKKGGIYTFISPRVRSDPLRSLGRMLLETGARVADLLLYSHVPHT